MGKHTRIRKLGFCADTANIFLGDPRQPLYFLVPLLNEGWGQAKSKILPALMVCESKTRLTITYGGTDVKMGVSIDTDGSVGVPRGERGWGGGVEKDKYKDQR